MRCDRNARGMIHNVWCHRIAGRLADDGLNSTCKNLSQVPCQRERVCMTPQGTPTWTSPSDQSHGLPIPLPQHPEHYLISCCYNANSKQLLNGLTHSRRCRRGSQPCQQPLLLPVPLLMRPHVRSGIPGALLRVRLLQLLLRWRQLSGWQLRLQVGQQCLQVMAA